MATEKSAAEEVEVIEEQQLDDDGNPIHPDPEPEAEEREHEEVETEEDDVRLDAGGGVAAKKADAADEEAEDKAAQTEGRQKRTSKERRELRKRNERRVREERDWLLEQNSQILQRLAQVEGTTIKTQLSVVDAKIDEHQNDAASAETIEFESQAKGDFEGVRQARRIRELATDKVRFFKSEKERLAQYAQAQAGKPIVAPIPGAAEIQSYSARFAADKPWLQFDANGTPRNPETNVTLSIDHALRSSGMDARDPGYWDELEKRVKAALPHKYAQAADDTDDEDEDEVEVQVQQQKAVKQPVQQAAAKSVAKKGPTVGSSGNQTNAGARRVRLSPDRVQALKDLGVWDAHDPATKKDRDSYIKAFEQYDKDHGVNS